jgi:hypothetical protein
MSKARQEKRSKIKPFIKVVNYNHLMPTRYTLELEGLKGSVTADTFKEVSQREDAKKTVKKTLEERYTSGKNRWFFTPLRMCLQFYTLRAGARAYHLAEYSLWHGYLLTMFPYNRLLNLFPYRLGRANGFGMYTASIGIRPKREWL